MINYILYINSSNRWKTNVYFIEMADKCLRPIPDRPTRHPFIGKLETIFKNPNSSQLAKSLYLLSLTFTFLSIVQFCMETLPDIKSYSEQGSTDLARPFGLILGAACRLDTVHPSKDDHLYFWMDRNPIQYFLYFWNSCSARRVWNTIVANNLSLIVKFKTRLKLSPTLSGNTFIFILIG